MSKNLNVENGALISGYDNLAASQWCTPSFLGCSACVSVSAVKGQVTITVSLNTPFGNVSKSFNFNTNVNFTWQPFSKFKITFAISNFNDSDGVFSFDLSINPCVDVPILGWKCFNYSHHFVVPVVLNGIQNEVDDSHFTSILALHSGGSLANSCSDCNNNSGASMLKGDIYSNYLNQPQSASFPTLSCIPTLQCIPTTISCIPTAQCTGLSPICATQNDSASANIPTIPVVKCIPIPTVQCIPTVTSCITGVSPICATQQHATANAASFPTLSCIPTLQCIPTTVSCIPTAQCTGVSPICATQNDSASANFPTIPVVKCLPIPTVQCIPTVTSCITGVSPICATQQHATANAASFPTLSCIPTLQCIPTTVSCIPTAQCTGVSPICATQNDSASANFPTIPVVKCLPIPTVQCVPTVTSCVTGVSPICASEQHANANAAAIPTLPVSSCVPTVSCVPTISCIPTISCTGIPFIC
jgi:hypothetical protein